MVVLNVRGDVLFVGGSDGLVIFVMLAGRVVHVILVVVLGNELAKGCQGRKSSFIMALLVCIIVVMSHILLGVSALRREIVVEASHPVGNVVWVNINRISTASCVFEHRGFKVVPCLGLRANSKHQGCEVGS